MIKKNDTIFLAGHLGLVGSNVYRLLNKKGYKKVITQTRKQLNLNNGLKVFNYLKRKKPKVVIIAAAKVGGIIANNIFRADFISENLNIQNNLINGCFKNKIKNIIFLGSSCIYPKKAKQPIKEDYLLSGKLEKTNEPYAIAKIAGVKLCESYNLQYKMNYKCIMPCNTFGPGDNYNNTYSHFIPAILKKIYIANKLKKKKINLFGTGKPKREVLYVEDLAEAIIYFMNKKTKSTLINVGSGKDFSVSSYARKILRILNYDIKVKFNYDKKLDGINRKLLDITLAKSYGWQPKISFEQAIKNTFKDLEKNYKKYRH